MKPFAAAVSAVLSLACAHAAQAAEVLLAKPGLTVAMRKADIEDCRAIFEKKPRDPAMEAAFPTPEGPLAPEYAAHTQAQTGMLSRGIASSMEWEVSLERCLRLKGYVLARLTRKELGQLRERLAHEQDEFVESLIASGRLDEATRPLVAPLPRIAAGRVWRIVPGSVKAASGPVALGETLVTARVVFAHQARLNAPLVVEEGKLTIPAGAIFFRSQGRPDGRPAEDLQSIPAEPAWCTVLSAAAGRDAGSVLCLFNHNDGYKVLVVKLQQMAWASGKARVDGLVASVDLTPLDAPSSAPLDVGYVTTRAFTSAESLHGTTTLAGATVGIETQLLNAMAGVDRVLKGREAGRDIDAGPVEITIGDQRLEVTAAGKGKERAFEARLLP